MKQPERTFNLTAIEKEKEQAALAPAQCSAQRLSMYELIFRLASRGLVPFEHNLQIWQHADGSGWGASIQTPFPQYDAEAHGADVRSALENLMVGTNQSKPVEPNDGR
jgi:hypothetical protein